MKINNVKIGENLSPSGEYFKVLKHLQKVSEAYRATSDKKEKALLNAELYKYGALNINNGSGYHIITI